MRWPFADLWDHAPTYDRFAADAVQNRVLWESMYRLARVPAWALEAARALPPRRLVVLNEDWCGDAVNTVPVVAKWASEVPWELRILRRDEHPAVMDRYLTGGTARSIPVVVVLTAELQELGWWGPRPSELQAWVMERRRSGAGTELYPETRRWYARDKGESTLREVLAVAELTAG